MLGHELVATDHHRGSRQDTQFPQHVSGSMPPTDLYFTMLWE